jgi:hypothetical protein
MSEQKSTALSGLSGSIEPEWPSENEPTRTITEDGSLVWVLA